MGWSVSHGMDVISGVPAGAEAQAALSAAVPGRSLSAGRGGQEGSHPEHGMPGVSGSSREGDEPPGTARQQPRGSAPAQGLAGKEQPRRCLLSFFSFLFLPVH